MCASVHNHRQVRNVPQDVSRTMQHLQLFQEDCPYERDLRVSVLTWCWVHVCRDVLLKLLAQDVLGAFALMRQDVGYVQSMSYIAAMFLLYAFTLLRACTHSNTYRLRCQARHTSHFTRHTSHVTQLLRHAI
jgi:hypothetical protein